MGKRTRRGLAIALGIAAAALLYYHVVRPWLGRHGVRAHIDEDVASALKAALAFSALCLSVWALTRRLSGRPFRTAIVTSVTVLYGALGVAAFISSDDLGATSFTHKWELFHYYLGSKYPKELGYERLYVCAAIAQSELGASQLAEVRARRIRNLETDVIEQAAPTLEHPEACKDHFTPQRWEAFKTDVAWFRNNSSRDHWNGMQIDHGYNPPPVWTTTGHLVGSLFPVATNASMSILASIDTVLFALTFFAVWWAFGLQTCCIALVFWGVQFPANGFFTGGAFLRQDWLLCLVVAACLLRRHYWALAGASLATSSLLRVFPAIFFAGIVVVTLAYLLRHRRFATHHLRVFAGALVAAAVLVSASIAVAGPESYGGFAHHIRLHHRTPLTNNMGLPVLLSFTPAGRAELTRDKSLLDEFEKWGAAHSATLERRRPLYLGINALIATLFVAVVHKMKTLWLAMALSAILVMSIPALTCYYYSFLLVPVLMAKVSPAIGRLVLFAAGMSALLIIWPRASFQWDDRYSAQTVVFFSLASVLLLTFSTRRRKTPTLDGKGVERT